MNLEFLKRLRQELDNYNFDEVELSDEEVQSYLDYLHARKELIGNVIDYEDYISNPLQDRIDNILSYYGNIKDYNIRVGKTKDGVAKLRVYSYPKQRKLNLDGVINARNYLLIKEVHEEDLPHFKR